MFICNYVYVLTIGGEFIAAEAAAVFRAVMAAAFFILSLT